MPKKILLLFLISLLLPLVSAVAARNAGVPPGEAPLPLAELRLSGRDLAAGSGRQLQLTRAGVTLAPAADSAVYVSAPLEAPIPFNALVPQWRGTALADPANFRFYVRSGEPLAERAWVEIRPDADMTLPEDEAITGNFYMLPQMGQTHRRLQVRVDLQRRAGGEAPHLAELTLTFLDSSAAPTPQEALSCPQAQSVAADGATAPAGYPKPEIVPRECWCLEDACTYSEGLSYHPVSHLILHHTAIPVTDNAIASLQAIWLYHTFSLGWGDIGYNYLVYPDGTLYEGHLGGENVVGTHAGGANTGSLGLSMMGDFTDAPPPPAVREAVVELFAWKADQMGIDVFDASRLPNMAWGMPHLAGHRDAYGTTSCPGDAAHPLLPAIRDEVARRIGFTPPHLYYDELSPATHFDKIGANYWENGPLGCGYNGHAYYTWSVTETVKSTNQAWWRPEVPFPGRYELSVYAPYCNTGMGDTGGAQYRVTDVSGTTPPITIDQEANLGLWTSLGTYEFAAGTAGSVYLTDLTETDAELGVWFDAIRLRPLPPAVATAVPANGEWVAENEVTFHWSLTNEINVAGQTFQLAGDPDFARVLAEVPLAAATRVLSRRLEEGVYYWRLRLNTPWGVSSTSPVWDFGVDTTPPTSAITAVYQYADGSFLVTWRGEDAYSEVVGYNIEYRAEGTEEWRSWLRDTRQTGALFVPPGPDGVYWFRSQARDRPGWLEPFPTGPGDSSTADSIHLDMSPIRLPLLLKE